MFIWRCINREMRLNDAGLMIERWWNELHRTFPHMETDEFVVMPNHIHGIIVITAGADLASAQMMRAHMQGRPYRKSSNG
jgi:REP element-mobilizing transposase RayT